MKKVLLFVFAMTVSSLASAETIAFTCANIDRSKNVELVVGDAKDGYPLEAFTLNGNDMKASIIQYVFELSQNGLVNMLKAVETTEDGRVHTQAGIQLTEQGVIMQYVTLNIDAENIEDTVTQEVLACAEPKVTDDEAPAATSEAAE